MNIGFIGLGHMGQPMVVNLLNAGFHVRVFDVKSEAALLLTARGAEFAGSIVDATTDMDVVITMVQTGAQVKEICLQQGLFDNLKPGALYVDSSTIDIETCNELHQIAIDKQIHMLDAPVSGGVAAAELGTLTFMVGGDESNFLRAKPILETMGKKIIYAGHSGHGIAAKICNNLILGISMIAVSESFALAKKLGLDQKKFFEISSNASGQCWAMTSNCPVPGIIDKAPSNNDYKPGFMAKMMLKDLYLSMSAGHYAKAATPLGEIATELYQVFVDAGNGEDDFSAIIKMMG